MRRRLKVEPIPGEIFRFLVESQRSGVPPYLVDLSAMDGNGLCACEHYEFRLFSLIKAQLHLPWRKRVPIACIHLHDAREYFLQEIIHGLMDRQEAEAKVERIIGQGVPPVEEPKKESWRWNFQKFFHWRETTKK